MIEQPLKRSQFNLQNLWM